MKKIKDMKIQAQNLKCMTPYLRDVDKYSLLTPDEELRIGRLTLAGDQQAINSLITSNLRLVLFVARRYLYKGVGFLDLVGEGNLGLITAANKWDYRKNTKFSTYAIYWIRRSILAALNTQTLVRSAVNLNSAKNSLHNKIQQHELESGKKMDATQVKLKFGKRYQNYSVDNLLDHMSSSYCDIVVINQDGELSDRNSPGLVSESFEREVENRDARQKLHQRLEKLFSKSSNGSVLFDIYVNAEESPYLHADKTDKYVKSLGDLARQRGVTVQAVNCWKTNAFEKIRARHTFEDFKDYLEG